MWLLLRELGDRRGGRWSGLPGQELAGGAAEGVADGGQGAEPDGAGVPVLEDGQVGDGDSDASGQFDQGHALRLEKVVQVHRDPVIGRFGHQMTLSSSVRMATPLSRIRPMATKISPTATQPSGDWWGLNVT